jgi:hypothetical protein
MAKFNQQMAKMIDPRVLQQLSCTLLTFSNHLITEWVESVDFKI